MTHDPDSIHLPAMPLPPGLPPDDDGCTGEGRGRGHTYTASEVKVLTETATRVALELGRREGLNEAADIADAFPDDVVNREKPYNEAFIHACGCVAREIRKRLSQPPGAISDATSGVPGHPEVSEAVRSPQEPPKLVCRRCNGYGLLGVAAGVNPVPCPDCALPAREQS